jgi:curli production assembly/transport component CsgE
MSPTHYIRLWVLPCLLLLEAAAGAAPGPTPSEPGTAANEILDGIIVNQTVTVAGQEFHTAFAALWSDKPGLSSGAISIRERPSASRGTTVEVQRANHVVFRATLPPARSQLRALAEQAVEVVYENAVSAQVQQFMLRDDDLAPDEF